MAKDVELEQREGRETYLSNAMKYLCHAMSEWMSLRSKGRAVEKRCELENFSSLTVEISVTSQRRKGPLGMTYGTIAKKSMA